MYGDAARGGGQDAGWIAPRWLDRVGGPPVARTSQTQRLMPKAKTVKPVVIAHVSDMHAGSTVALCPPTLHLDDGGVYHASKFQRWLWQSWLAYWDRITVLRKRHKADLYVILNGDLVEGHHHRNTHIVANNPNAQAHAVNAMMRVPLDLKPERLFVVRGTEAHAGSEGSSEERIADGLRRDKRPIVGDPESGTASWWHLRLEVNDVLIDVTHHGRTGGREHTRAGAASLHAHDILLSHVKRGERPPDLCLRGHWHRFNDSGDACDVRVITSGAWQGKSGHVHKVAPDTVADFGGLAIVVTDGDYTVEKVKFEPDPSPIWRAK